jgi:predicted dinucleotide-binding enzyme
VVVPSNPITADAHGNLSRLLPQGQASGNVVAGWLPAGARLAMAFGTLPADLLDQSTRLEVGGDLHELVVGPAQAQSLVSTA